MTKDESPGLSSSAFVVERSVVIRARRSVVFGYFTDAARFAAWWGAGSTIDGRPGGEVRIRYPNGATASGKVLALTPDERIVFTYGYDDPGKTIPSGGSRVTITLADHPEGTRLELRHEVGDAATRDAHVLGWRFQLSRFAEVAAAEQHAEVAALIDRFFAAWNEADDGARARLLAATVTDATELCDAWAALVGRDELAAHIAAARQHRPGVCLERDGAALHCQGTAVVEWVLRSGDGELRGRGLNVFTLASDGRIAKTVGLARS
jgi:uncharacterized protein YndB with AHSA1/START domain